MRATTLCSAETYSFANGVSTQGKLITARVLTVDVAENKLELTLRRVYEGDREHGALEGDIVTGTYVDIVCIDIANGILV